MNKAQQIGSVHKYIERYYKLFKSRKELPHKNVITVYAETLEDFIICMADHRGAMHQHFFAAIREVIEGDKNIVEHKPVFVAVRYGDKAGLEAPLPHLEPNNPIIVKGVYIPSNNTYQTSDNPGFPVLHFTHHPLGYIIYNGVKYE